MKDILERLKLLIIKLLGIKGIILIISTILFFMGKIDMIFWELTVGAVIGLRTVEKINKKEEEK